MEFVYRAWFTSGPDIRYELTNGFGFGGRRGPGGFPSYADLMTATDDSGRARSYLASEENFTLIKTLETRNLLVPVVGNFGGLKALKSIAGYLKSRGLVPSRRSHQRLHPIVAGRLRRTGRRSAARLRRLRPHAVANRRRRGGLCGALTDRRGAAPSYAGVLKERS
jgi:hypothetical protein